jgi:hypothetical protein
LKVFFDEDVPRKLARHLPLSRLSYWRQMVRPHVHKIAAAIDEARPGTVKMLDCGVFNPRLKRGTE